MDDESLEQRSWTWSHEMKIPSNRQRIADSATTPNMPAVPGASMQSAGGPVLRSMIDACLDRSTPIPASAPATHRSPRSKQLWRYRPPSGPLLPKQRGLFNPSLPLNTLQIDERSFAQAALVKAEEVLQLDEQRLSALHQKWDMAVKKTGKTDRELDALSALLAERNKTIETLQESEGRQSKAHQVLLGERDGRIKELKGKVKEKVEKMKAMDAEHKQTQEKLKQRAAKEAIANAETLATRDATIQELTRRGAAGALALADREAVIREQKGQVNAFKMQAERDALAATALVAARDERIEELLNGAESSAATVTAREATIREKDGVIRELRVVLTERVAEIKELNVAAAERSATIEAMRDQADRDGAANAALLEARDATVDGCRAVIEQLRSVIAQHEDTIRSLTLTGAERDATIEELRKTIERGGEAWKEIVAAREATIEALEEKARADAAKHVALSDDVERQGGRISELVLRAEAAEAFSAKLVARARWKLVRDRGVIEALKAKRQRDFLWSQALVAARDGTIAKLEQYGRIVLRVSHAIGLRGVGRAPQPYLTMRLGGRFQRAYSSTGRGPDPRFDMETVFTFKDVDCALADTLIIEVFDDSIMLMDNKIGDGQLKIEPHRRLLEANEHIETSVPIMYKPILRKAVPAGEVFVSLMWEPRAV